MECLPSLHNLICFSTWHYARYCEGIVQLRLALCLHHCCAVWFGDWPDLCIIFLLMMMTTMISRMTVVMVMMTMGMMMMMMMLDTLRQFGPFFASSDTTVFSLPATGANSMGCVLIAGTWTQNIASHTPTLLRRSFSTLDNTGRCSIWRPVSGPRSWFENAHADKIPVEVALIRFSAEAMVSS